jgi:hypothetical protein
LPADKFRSDKIPNPLNNNSFQTPGIYRSKKIKKTQSAPPNRPKLLAQISDETIVNSKSYNTIGELSVVVGFVIRCVAVLYVMPGLFPELYSK